MGTVFQLSDIMFDCVKVTGDENNIVSVEQSVAQEAPSLDESHLKILQLVSWILIFHS